MKKFYTRAQAVRLLGVSVITLDRARRGGSLRCTYEGRTPLFLEDDLRRWKDGYDLARSGIRALHDGRQLYNGSAAARYVGMTRQGFNWHKRQRHVLPDGKRGQLDMYSKEILDKFVRERKMEKEWNREE